MWKNSLKIKLVVSFALISLVAITIAGVSTLASMRKTVEQEIQNTLLFLAEAKDGQVFAYLDSLESRTIDFSSDGFIRDSLKEIVTTGSTQAVESLNQHLTKNKQSLDPTIGGIMVFDLNGKMVAATNDKEIGKDESDEEYVIEGKKGIFVIEFKEHAHFGLGKFLAVAAPLTDKETNETLGVIVNVFDTIKLSSILSGKFQLEKGAISANFGRIETLAVYLVNKEKKILAHSHLASVHKEEVYKIGAIDTSPVQKCLSNKEEIVGTYLNYLGEEVIGASMCFPRQGWVLLTEINTQEVFAPVRSAIYGLVIMLIFILLFVVLDVFLIAEKIINPIKKLHEATDIIAQGNLNYKVDIKTGDEVEQLANAFNQMAGKLKSFYKDLKKKIKERTRELDATNQQLRASEQQLRAGNQQLTAAKEQLQEKIKDLDKNRLILYSLAEDIQKEKEGVEIKVKERTKELSEEHEKLFSLVNSVKLGVIMVDLSLKIVLANPAAKTILGKSPSGNISFADLKEKVKDIRISQAFSHYITAGKSLYIQEVKINGRHFRLFLSPVRNAVEKTSIGAVVIFEDVTEQKIIDTMRTEIVSVTSHQLRTPLSVIKGNLEMVLEGDVGKITGEQKEILSEALAGDERMIKLVNDLMDITKITEGRFELELKPEDFESLVNETIKEISAFAKNNNTEVIYEKSLKALPKINLDRQRIKQVMQNLIDDAIKYSHRGHQGKVEVKLKKISDKAVELTIADNGIGIPKEEQAKIFEKFFRASNVSKFDPGSGTGLGLFIAKSIVEQHGGKIRFESKENKGTTFFISLPI